MTYTRVAVAQIPDWSQAPDLPREMAETLRELALRALSPMASKVLDKARRQFEQLQGNRPQLVADRAIAYLKAVVDFCRHRQVHVLVFPELSIQRSWLPRLAGLVSARPAAGHGPSQGGAADPLAACAGGAGAPGEPIPVTVAGTHLYNPLAPGSQDYRACRLRVPTSWRKQERAFSVAPVLLSNTKGGLKRGSLVPKLRLSSFEDADQAFPFPDDWDPHVVAAVQRRSLNLTVLACSDFHLGNLDEICESRVPPHLILVPAWTPFASVFNDYLAKARRYRGVGRPTLIANSPHRLEHEGKVSETGGSLIYALVSHPHHRVEIGYRRDTPLASFIYPIPPDTAAVTVVDVDLARQKEKTYDAHRPQTYQVTVAPLISRATFPEYCRFYEAVRDRKHSTSHQRYRAICCRDGQAVRAATLAHPRCLGLFHDKLLEVRQACSQGDEAIRQLQSHANGDLERLVDMVPLPDDKQSKLERLWDDLTEGLCQLAADLPNKDRPEVLRLAREMSEAGERLAAGLGVPADAPSKPPRRQHPVPRARAAKTAGKPSPVMRPATAAAAKSISAPEGTDAALTSLLMAAQFLDQVWFVGEKEALTAYLKQSVSRVLGNLGELILVRDLGNAEFPPIAKGLATFGRAVLEGIRDRSSLEVYGLAESGKGKMKSVLTTDGLGLDTVVHDPWAELPISDDPKKRSQFLRNLENAIGTGIIKMPPSGKGPSRRRKDLTSDDLIRMVKNVFFRGIRRGEPASALVLRKRAGAQLFDRIERVRKNLAESYRDLPSPVLRKFEQDAGLSVFFACSADPGLVSHGLFLAIDLVSAMAAFRWPRLWERLAALPAPMRVRLLADHRKKGLNLLPRLADRLELLFSDPEKNWYRYREVFNTWSRLVTLYQETVILSQLRLFEVGLDL